MKILITGCRGMLAHDLIDVLRSEHELLLFDEFSLDITDAQNVSRTLADACPDAVINCAAFTNVDGCETEKEVAFAVNAAGAGNLAEACREAGSVLYQISTDFVFDGSKRTPYTEADHPNPQSVYGASKFDGEVRIQALLPDHVIIRTSWLFGRHGKNFVETILKLAAERDELRVVDDQTGCPTSTVDLASALKKLLATQARGIYHVSNAGACSWYAFARRIVSSAGLTTHIIPITSQELNRPAPRPAYSVLDCSRFTDATGLKLTPWEEALDNYMRHHHNYTLFMSRASASS